VVTAVSGDPDVAPIVDVLTDLHDGPWLDAFDPPPMAWAVPGLIPEGLTLLAGAPKRGKSWLALDICLAVASGRVALGGLPVEPGRVAYLALEDGARRLRERVRLLNGEQPTPSSFTFATSVPVPFSTYLEAYAERHPATRLLVLDTLGRVRPASSRNGDRYAEDYRLMGWLQRFALDHAMAVVVVHHTRKAASDDFVDDVSGTHGLAGAADAVMVLKRPRGEADGVLHVTGRDVEERDVYLRRVGPAWVIFDGTPAQANYSPDMARVITAVNTSPEGIGPKAVAHQTQLPYDNVKVYLARAEERGQVRKVERGRYAPLLPAPVTSVTSVTADVAVGR
jgi:hypothetical protein